MCVWGGDHGLLSANSHSRKQAMLGVPFQGKPSPISSKKTLAASNRAGNASFTTSFSICLTQGASPHGIASTLSRTLTRSPPKQTHTWTISYQGSWNTVCPPHRFEQKRTFCRY